MALSCIRVELHGGRDARGLSKMGYVELSWTSVYYSIEQNHLTLLKLVRLEMRLEGLI